MNRRTAKRIFKGVDYNNREEITELYVKVRDSLLRRLEREHFDKEKKKISNHLAKLEKAYTLLIEVKPTKYKKAAITYKNFTLILSNGILILFLLIRISNSCDWSKPGSDGPYPWVNYPTSDPNFSRDRLERQLTEDSLKIFIEDEEGLYMKMIEVRGDPLFPKQNAVLEDFYIGQFEVTYYQFAKFLDETRDKKYLNNPDEKERWEYNGPGNPKKYRKKEFPAVNVSWYDALMFCEYLSEKTGKHYRLPTEAEWKYAANSGRYNFIFRSFSDAFWHKANSKEQLRKVGLKRPNVLGLHDMRGNVWEWCADETSDSLRAVRGGSFLSYDFECSVASQKLLNPDYRDISVGFRVVWQPSLTK